MHIIQEIRTKAWLLLSFALFTFLRVPSLLEPAWYGDEGIYAAVANEMVAGELLYTQIWDHKTPGIYLVYSIAEIFQNIEFQLFFLKLINFCLGLLTLYVAYRLLRLLFAKSKPAIYIPIVVMSVFLGGPWLEANIFNAENIFILFTTLGFYLFFKFRQKKELNFQALLMIGLIFGFAVFFKVHPALDFIALFLGFSVLLFKDLQADSWKHKSIIIFKKLFILGLGSIIPLLVSAIYFLIAGNLGDFIFAVIEYNFGYSGSFSPTGPGFLFFQDNLTNRIILILAIISLTTYLYLKKKISLEFMVILFWVMFAFFGVRISSRPYPHYLLQLLPPVTFLLGWGISKGIKQVSWVILFIFALLNLYAQGGEIQWGYMERSYLSSGYQYIAGVKSKAEWYSEFNQDAENNLLLAESLTEYEGQEVLYWGSNPWVYELADIRNPIPYTVYYHIDDRNINEVMEQLREDKPKAILIDYNFPVRKELIGLIVNDYREIEVAEFDSKGEEQRFRLYRNIEDE